MQVREDSMTLFGFVDAAERDAFRLLITVQGVGAKVALAIMSVLSGDELTDAVIAEDKAAVSRANGVGPKLAARIVIELRDKVGAMKGPMRKRKENAGGRVGKLSGWDRVTTQLPSPSPS